MKQVTIKEIRDWGPCYDPIKHIPETWSGTILDVLSISEVPFQDRLWLILRTELVSEKLMRLFAVWSYRQTLKFITNPDPRSVKAAEVAESFANGNAIENELSAAESAARSAARSAAESAARSAESAARSAAWSAESAARSAESAARSAARSAAESAARSAAESAAWSAWSARSAAWSAQENKLREMIIAGIETGDVR